MLLGIIVWIGLVEEKEQIRSMFRDYHIDFYLSGHVHQSMISYDQLVDTHYCVCRHMRYDDNISGGLIFGSINTVNGNNRIQFYTFKKGSYWAIDNEVGMEAPDGIFKINTQKFSSINYREKPILLFIKQCMLREHRKVNGEIGV